MQYRKDESAEGKTQVAWVTAWNTFLKELRAFIKTYHTTDLTWNAQVRRSLHRFSSTLANPCELAEGARFLSVLYQGGEIGRAHV